MLKSNLVFITGMHRSGTSVAARAVMACGYTMGDNLMPGSRDNPKGFFEDLELVAINDAIMAAAGVSWNTVKEPIHDLALVETLRDRMNRFWNNAKTWGEYIALKDPRFCVTYPQWIKFLTHWTPEPVFNWAVVGSFRNPLETLQSVMLRDGMSRQATIALWNVYNKGMLAFMEHTPSLVCAYEYFLYDQASELELLNRFLGNEPHSLLPEERNEFKDFMTESLHRHRAEPIDVIDLYPEMKNVAHEIFIRILRSKVVFNP